MFVNSHVIMIMTKELLLSFICAVVFVVATTLQESSLFAFRLPKTIPIHIPHRKTNIFDQLHRNQRPTEIMSLQKLITG